MPRKFPHLGERVSLAPKSRGMLGNGGADLAYRWRMGWSLGAVEIDNQKRTVSACPAHPSKIGDPTPTCLADARLKEPLVNSPSAVQTEIITYICCRIG